MKISITTNKMKRKIAMVIDVGNLYFISFYESYEHTTYV